MYLFNFYKEIEEVGLKPTYTHLLDCVIKKIDKSTSIIETKNSYTFVSMMNLLVSPKKFLWIRFNGDISFTIKCC